MDPPPPRRVGIVGAGVAGLVCARELESVGVLVDVYEAAHRVGGRVQTDDVEGYQLDLGFQILIDSYPEVCRVLDLRKLRLRSFAPGAVLAHGGSLSLVAHPFKCPLKLLPTLKTAFGWGLMTSFMDIFRLGRLALGWLFTSPYKPLETAAKFETTDAFMKRLGLSSAITEQFLRPFFEAIYVSPLAEQSAAMFQFVLRMLAVGKACLPARGMRAVPEQLADGLQRPVRLLTPVTDVRSDALKVGAQWHEYSAIIVAADWPAASKLLQLPPVRGTRSATWYFGFPAPAPLVDPIIVLHSYGAPSEIEGVQSRVVNVGFPSSVQPSYAPPGYVLAAVTVMGPNQDEAWVRTEVEHMLGTDCSNWKHLRTYDIEFHQPAQVPLQPVGSVACELGGVFCCGDHRADPTLDGAMRSGRRAAEAVRRKLRV